MPSGRGDLDQQHAVVEQYRLLDRCTYREATPAALPARLGRGAALFAQALARRPGVALRTLNVFRLGRAALTGRLLFRGMPLIRRHCPKYDVIHAHFAPCGLAAIELRMIGAIAGPILTTFHGYDITVGSPQTLAARYRRLFRRGEAFTVNTPFTADRAAAIGCPTDKIIELPVGVNLHRIAFRQRTLAPGQTLRLLSVGRLVENKGHQHAIAAVAQLRRRYPNVEYRIVGEGPLRPALEKRIASHQLRKHVFLVGAETQTHVRREYDRAHLFLHPSIVTPDGQTETQGLVIQEAQAAGLPVIASRIGGIPAGVLDGETGFLVPQKDPRAIVDQLVRLIDRAADWPDIGRKGRAFVAEHFDIDMLNDRLVDIYARLED